MHHIFVLELSEMSAKGAFLGCIFNIPRKKATHAAAWGSYSVRRRGSSGQAEGNFAEFRLISDTIVAPSLREWREIKNPTTTRAHTVRRMPIYGMMRRNSVRHRNNILPRSPPDFFDHGSNQPSTLLLAQPPQPNSPEKTAAQQPLRRSCHPMPQLPPNAVYAAPVTTASPGVENLSYVEKSTNPAALELQATRAPQIERVTARGARARNSDTSLTCRTARVGTRRSGAVRAPKKRTSYT
jgi:hypothetical protein